MLKDSDKEHPHLTLPQLEQEAYLVGLLHEAGLMSSSGMGPISLSWVDIKAWLDTAELQLTVWEKLTIKELSDIFVSELSKSTDKHCPPPYLHIEEDKPIDREAVANKLKDALRSFRRKQ